MNKLHFPRQHAIVIGLALGVISPANGQDLPGDASSGKQIAVSWCAACHRINSNAAPVGGVPDFDAIANLPSTTALSLKVFLQTSHARMPNFRLTQKETDDVIAYILSIKK